uniref:ribosomal protein L20 n=1 Tax=Dapsilanthus disjunctus TaxID=2919630 RepID=UPI001F147BBD|nr:ribosomal protein L20 [Dapsilanthus disjunctus]ULQ65091.1 ribosomal protein L20 [Dapsilanthus disjunctus]ULQ65179.1 ribosomal protein L20 [Dapsilanthus disjunctus]
MTKAEQGCIARRRRKRIRSFASTYKGARSRGIRMMTQQKMRALASSHRDRGRKKRDFRRLWITRINAVTREKAALYSFYYNKLIHNLYKKQSLLNRKMLGQMALENKNGFYAISEKMDPQAIPIIK